MITDILEPYSVLMTVYHKESPEYLRRSFDSILNQTLPAGELVLVCDGPLTIVLDAVVDEYVTRYPDFFRVIRLDNHLGQGPALRAGLVRCQYEYIARMDSDDISCPDRCEKQLGFMQEMRLDLCSGAIVEFKHDPKETVGRRALPLSHEELVRFTRRRNPMNHPSVMFRKSKAIEAGNYRKVSRFEDYDLWIRMIQNGARLGNIAETLLYMCTGQGMYRRRGGLAYITDIVFFWKLVYYQGFVNLPEYLFMVLSRSIVSLLPGALRTGIYYLCLRES